LAIVAVLSFPVFIINVLRGKNLKDHGLMH
jgi:hypothetical protein